MFVILYILLLIFSFNTNFLVEDLSHYSGQYIVYTNTSCDFKSDKIVATDNYTGQVFKTDIKNYKLLLNNIDYVSSETVVLKDVDLDTILKELGADIKERVIVSDSIILYNCYSKKYLRTVNSYDYKINIQIAVSNNSMSIGYPILIDY